MSTIDDEGNQEVDLVPGLVRNASSAAKEAKHLWHISQGIQGSTGGGLHRSHHLDGAHHTHGLLPMAQHISSNDRQQHMTWHRCTGLPDGGHGKVKLHKDGAKGQQASCCKEDVGVAGPVGRGHMPRNLVGSGGVSDDWLLSRNHTTCASITFKDTVTIASEHAAADLAFTLL